MERPGKIRADELLVQLGLAESRSRAQALIMAGKVYHRGQPVEKAGKTFRTTEILSVEAPLRFVSRGGEKLEAFFKAFPVPVQGQRVLDIGASTGGFTDCALQYGAEQVVCVDVGKAQLHHRLAQDPRVHALLPLNARYLEPSALPHPDYGLVVMDLSFISLKKVLVPAWACVAPSGCLIALVKPQFEAHKQEVDKGQGVIRDPAIHARVLADLQAFITHTLPGATCLGCIPSPIRGGGGRLGAGNQEFLIGYRKLIGG